GLGENEELRDRPVRDGLPSVASRCERNESENEGESERPGGKEANAPPRSQSSTARAARSHSSVLLPSSAIDRMAVDRVLVAGKITRTARPLELAQEVLLHRVAPRPAREARCAHGLIGDPVGVLDPRDDVRREDDQKLGANFRQLAALEEIAEERDVLEDGNPFLAHIVRRADEPSDHDRVAVLDTDGRHRAALVENRRRHTRAEVDARLAERADLRLDLHGHETVGADAWRHSEDDADLAVLDRVVDIAELGRDASGHLWHALTDVDLRAHVVRREDLRPAEHLEPSIGLERPNQERDLAARDRREEAARGGEVERHAEI